MGHTLVACFGSNGEKLLREALGPYASRLNKVPYGRDGNRTQANRELPYHMTVAHWGRNDDQQLLQALEGYSFIPCTLSLTGLETGRGTEGSILLYFRVRPHDDYLRMAQDVSRTLGIPTTTFYHVTIAAEKDRNLVRAAQEYIGGQANFPLEMPIASLDLYHIWSPVRFVKRFTN